MKSLNLTLATALALSLFACKKEKEEEPTPTTSHEMVVVATNYVAATPSGTVAYHAFITDLQGNVLDYEEIAEGSTTVISTGDPNVQYFDFHLVTITSGQFNSTSATSFHNITGDTIELGFVGNTDPQFSHSKLNVNGVPGFSKNLVFDGGYNTNEIFGSGASYITGEVFASVDDPQQMFLSYQAPGEDKYRYYWNKNVLFGENLVVNHADLPQMSSLKNLQMPAGFTTDYMFVYGKPNESTVEFQLNKSEQPGAVSEIPVFVPENFATDFRTTLVSHNDNFRYVSNFNELPDEFVAPVVDFNLANTPGTSFSFTGTGFDYYNVIYYQSADAISWVIYGPKEDNATFKFPVLPDSIVAKIGITPSQLTEPPVSTVAIDFQPDVPFENLLPHYVQRPYEQKHDVSKQ